MVVLCLAAAYPPDQARKFPKPASKLSVRRKCKVKLDRRKKNLPNTKDHLNSTMCVLRHAHTHTHTYTHTSHVLSVFLSNRHIIKFCLQCHFYGQPIKQKVLVNVKFCFKHRGPIYYLGLGSCLLHTRSTLNLRVLIY